MKTKIYLIFFLSILLASCSSLQQSTVHDDIYYSPKDEAVASSGVYENPSYDKSQSTVFSNRYDKEIADILEDTSKSQVDTVIYKNEEENPYDRLIVDSYSESYERRWEAMKSPYYGMNNYFITFSDDYWYAQAYFNDPYYNVVILGDQIWVEPYWMSSWYYRPYWSYNYGYSHFYSPYYYSPYYSYYNPYYYGYPYNSYYTVDRNNNYVSSSFHSYRQRSVAGVSGTRTTLGGVRELPESYIGRDIRSSSTVKSGIDRQSVRTESGSIQTVRAKSDNLAGETIRVRETSRTRTNSAVRATTGQTQSGASRNYTRPKQATRSTYNSPTRSTTRYNRPLSSNVNSGRSSTGVSRTSNYTPNRSSSGSSVRNNGMPSRSSGSSYTPNRSRSSSGSSVNRSSGSSSRSSGSVRSSGSSTRSSSGSSSRSSGSSSRSSSGSSRRR